MLPNSLINSTCCAMSHPRPSPSSRKKPTRAPPPSASSIDSNDKSKRVSSTSLYTAKADKTDRPVFDPDSDDKRETSATSTNRGDEKLLDAARGHDENLASEQLKSDEKEANLIGIMTRQLYLAEGQMQRMQSVLKRAEERLKSKDLDIDRLKRKVKDWEAKNKNQDMIHKKEMQQRKIQIEDSEYLYRRCLKLEHKIFEMEKFLADYGLAWVGESKSAGAKRSEPMPNDFIKNCYAQLTANIEELNMSVGKGEVHVQRNENGGGASFKTPPCVCLKFFKNGMTIGDGKLRPYGNPKTGSFIRDILDGYFPSELQKNYPNGVPFKVEDHRTETCLGRGFPGHGYRLGKQRAIVGTRSASNTVQSPIAASVRSNLHSSISKRPSSSIDSEDHYSYNRKTGMSPVPSSARSSKTKFNSDTSSMDLLDLRTQILASHNNNCSDTHLQSHINAELGLTSRSETKRTLVTKTTEYHMSVKGKSQSSRTTHSESARLSSRSRTSAHNSAERLALGLSASRLTCPTNGIKPRPRSSSLTSGRYPLRSSSRQSTVSGNDVPTRNSNYSARSGTTKPRISKSATLDTNNELPIIRAINESTGNPGELRLKVRSMNGSIVFLVHVSADDTVARLYQLLDRALAKGRSRSYKVVMSGYEHKRLDQLGVPLREYGISRDSVLHLAND